MLTEYFLFWASNNWSFEREFIRIASADTGYQYSGTKQVEILDYHIFEIRKMLFYQVLYWPLVFTIFLNRIVNANNQFYNEMTRLALLRACFYSLKI